MSEDETPGYEITFSFTETVEVSPEMLDDHTETDTPRSAEAQDLAESILYTAPAFDELPDLVVDDATVASVVKKTVEDGEIQRRHERVNIPDEIAPFFGRVDPECPHCGSSDWTPSGRFSWTGDDGGAIKVSCEDCYESFTIQFRSVDVAWTDGGLNTYEAVAEGKAVPGYYAYPHADEYNHDGWEEAADD